MAEEAAVIDAPVEGADLGFDSPEVEVEGQGDQAIEGDAAEPVEGEEPAEKGHDGRNVPAKVRSALKAFRDASPEHAEAARILNDSYGREQAYKAVFAKVADAQAASQVLQSIGGPEGIQNVQAQLADVEEIDSLLADGDPAVLDRISEIAGEGLDKLAPEILNRVERNNPEAYAAAIQPHLVKALQATGLQGALGNLFEALQTARTPGASAEFKLQFEQKADKILSGIYQWLDKQGKVDPAAAQQPRAGDQKLSAREQAIATRETAAFKQEVGSIANAKMNTSLSKELNPYLAKLNLSPEAKKDLVEGIYNEVGRLAEADKTYQGQRKAAMASKKRDAAKVAALMTGKFDSVVADAVKNVVTRRYKVSAKAAETKAAPKPGQTTPTAAASASAPIKVAEKPDRSLWDMNKTTSDDIVRGRAYLKSGKLVAWR